MRISRIQIHNFRNFKDLDLHLGSHAVIVGENKIGKSNFLFALRLILDPKLSDAERNLRLEDFWDGLPRPLSKEDFIQISIEFSDFQEDENLLAILAQHLIQPEPMVSRLTYVFRPSPKLTTPPTKESDYEFFIYGAERSENRVGYEIRQLLPLTVLPALRNAGEDLANWRQSPLAPLLRTVAANIHPQKLEDVTSEISKARSVLADLADIKTLAQNINERLIRMVGSRHSVDTLLSFSPTDPNRLVRSLRLFIDGGARGISEASLGSANLIYLSLLSLELERQVQEGNRNHTFLAIEEPEAHLHPHLQRLAFRDFLQPRGQVEVSASSKRTSQTIFMTTHSPHIVSVSPLKSIAILRKSSNGESTIGVSTANLTLDESSIEDLERYVDVNRGELLFAKGVLLVEGSAEEFVVPVLGRLLGHDFDHLGISVCSVNGTNFEPYVQLLGPQALDIPFAILTDLDPYDDGQHNRGERRAIKLLEFLIPDPDFIFMDDEQILSSSSNYGIFLNDYTFEVDLFNCGQHEAMCSVLSTLTSNEAIQGRLANWQMSPNSLSPEQFLKDIDTVGKGRFAQRLASNLHQPNCPDYIREAIEYVVQRIH